MRADRSLVGVIGIALVASTALTLFIIGEGGGPYSIVKSEYSASGRGRWVSGVTLLCKEPIASLRLSHYCLLNRTELLADVDRNGTPEQICRRIPNLLSYLSTTQTMGQEPDVKALKVEMARWESYEDIVRETYDLILYDFSKIVWQAVPDRIMYSLERPAHGRGHLWDFYNCFACIFDDEGQPIFFYEGVADFFLNKVISIEELTVQKNEQKDMYYGVVEENSTDDAFSVLRAPDRGVVTFEDLKRNDHIAVYYSLDSSKTPLQQGGIFATPFHQIMRIVAISVDEGEPDYIFNVLDPPQPLPPD
jgi:hypothetical protein